jgi:CRP-like cAMP-binding protein
MAMTQLLPPPLRGPDPAAIRAAAWVARCVGHGELAPLRPTDVAALAGHLQGRRLRAGGVMFRAGDTSAGVWLLQAGVVELTVGAGRRRAVVGLLKPGSVDGDIGLLLSMPAAYTARALSDADCLFLNPAGFDRLLAEHPAIGRRWLTSVAARLANAQHRMLSLLGASLTQQAAQLIADEADNGTVTLPQRTLAAMLGVARPSLNKTLRALERDGLLQLGYRSITILDPARLTKATHR